MRIAVVGTGYVGLVMGVALSEIGHNIVCLDLDEGKVNAMKKGISPIYEPGLEELMIKNLQAGRLNFTTDPSEAFADKEVIYIAVGTPQKDDGHADLRYIEKAAEDIAEYVTRDIIVVTKSTVPVGTNERIRERIINKAQGRFDVDIVSNPEFLREGTAVKDTFYGDRIIIGTDSGKAAAVLEEINLPFGLPIYKTDLRSAEMIKYASNAFLATKISFINEIANLCEKLDADVEEVAAGMGMDNRIGNKFFQSGIGYGGSCFPKDTNALIQIASFVEHDFNLLKSVIEVNKSQQKLLVKKALKRFNSLQNKRVAILGLAFKPNTDDMREAASISICEELVKEGADIIAYDPMAIEKARLLLPKEVHFTDSVEKALENADLAFIVTEWEEIKNLGIAAFTHLMREPVIFDGRNCFSLQEAEQYPVDYYSIGRKAINKIDSRRLVR